MKKVGFIGAGKVGTTIGKYFFASSDEYNLVGYYSRTMESAKFAARFTNSARFAKLSTLVAKCDIIFICTPDDAIGSIVSELSGLNIQNKIICHTSGALSSNIFFDISSKSAYFCSLHPVMAINDKESSYKEMGSVFFTLEGDEEACSVFEKILCSKGNKYKIINSHDKSRYHMASVFLSNFVVALGQVSIDLLSEYGFTEREALDSLSYLSTGNLKKLIDVGPEKAITGPVERCDTKTIKKHLDSISSDKYALVEDIYRSVSLKLLEIAQNKHEDRDYRQMKEILEKGE